MNRENLLENRDESAVAWGVCPQIVRELKTAGRGDGTGVDRISRLQRGDLGAGIASRIDELRLAEKSVDAAISKFLRRQRPICCDLTLSPAMVRHPKQLRGDDDDRTTTSKVGVRTE